MEAASTVSFSFHPFATDLYLKAFADVSTATFLENIVIFRKLLNSLLNYRVFFLSTELFGSSKVLKFFTITLDLLHRTWEKFLQ